MNTIKLFVRWRSPSILLSRTITTKKKLHDPSEDEQLPIFQYPISKSSDRRVYVWGLAETGALGIHLPRSKKSGKKAYRNNFNLVWHPMRSSFCERFDVTKLACGYGFTVAAVKTNEQHKVFGTGINTDSQIGYHAPRIGHPLEMLLSPAPIYIPYTSLETKITGLAAGRAHTLILTDNEGVYTLGNNAYGQCGRKINPNEEYRGSMASHNIKRLGKEKIVDVCCGQDHSLFITESGRVYACGWGADGQTGLGAYTNQGFPALVKGDITSEKIVKVASTVDCVLALNEQGDVFVWGFGLLGLGPNVQQSTKPKQVPAPLFGRNEFNPDSMITNVACGIGHLAAITNKGDLYMWGRNRHGCLGLGHDKDQHFPLKIGIGAHVLSVKCSVDHTVAMCKPFT
ncbi:jg2743 [Pararge aegeria aegeria]|uniref:Jg2743 protein n=1 Tax=Pararge aegeria aegeria TaxID=348720 RepID=A0A8S4RCG3_9NEOP|nr:jg2743 [Pararge aegeria aegeria]